MLVFFMIKKALCRIFLLQFLYFVSATTTPPISCHLPVLKQYAATGSSVIAIGDTGEATHALWNMSAEIISQAPEFVRNAGKFCTFVEPGAANESELQPADLVFIT